MAWRAAPFEAVHGGAPRDYINDYKMGVDATLEPLKYILEANQQSNQQQQNNATNLNAAVGEQNRSTLAQATLALDRAKQAHYEQSDTARLALDQARENRLKTQDAAEEALTPLKIASTKAQIANWQFDQQAKISAMNNKVEDSQNLLAYHKFLNGLSNEDILDGKGNDLYTETGIKLNDPNSLKILDQMLKERKETGTLALQTKDKANWDIDELTTYEKDRTPKDQGGNGLSGNEAFAHANGLAQQRLNKSNIKAEDEEIGTNSQRTGALMEYGVNAKAIDQFADKDTKATVGYAENLAQARIALHKQDPSKDAYYKANAAQALKDAGYNNTPPPGKVEPDATTKDPLGYWLGKPKSTTTPTPSASQLNPSANQVPSTDSDTTQPITTTGFPSTMLSPEQHDTLGAVQDWRANQLADMQNAQQPANAEA